MHRAQNLFHDVDGAARTDSDFARPTKTMCMIWHIALALGPRSAIKPLHHILAPITFLEVW